MICGNASPGAGVAAATLFSHRPVAGVDSGTVNVYGPNCAPFFSLISAVYVNPYPTRSGSSDAGTGTATYMYFRVPMSSTRFTSCTADVIGFGRIDRGWSGRRPTAGTSGQP